MIDVRPPKVKLPAQAVAWISPWLLVEYSTFGSTGKVDSGKCWMRHYLVRDGHEDCCRHEEFVTRPTHNGGGGADG